MKKSLLIAIFLVLFLIPVLSCAEIGPKDSIVPCGQGTSQCTINDFFTMLAKIYSFIVWRIATPLATIGLLIGGIMLLVSAGNPNLATRGKDVIKVSIIGLVLVFCSWLIIKVILTTIGYKGTF